MASIQDRWTAPDGSKTDRHGSGARWRARYRDASGRERARTFTRKVDAQRWLDEVTTSVVSGTYVDPDTARTTVEQWCATWLDGYRSRRPATVRQAEVHLALILKEFGPLQLSAVRPSSVKSWTARLKSQGYADSTVYAVHNRLAQVLGDAVHDGLLARNPCSRRTSPGAGKQRPYVATTEQVWALHDAVPGHLQPRCCSARSLACARLRCAAYGSSTSTSCAPW